MRLERGPLIAARLDHGPLLAMGLAAVFHGPLILAGFYRHSADVATHIFFADHYRQDWFGLWEPRWFGGFSVSSYPPLVHQVMALLSPLTGYDRAFAIVLLATLVAFPAAVWRFAAIFVPPRAARAAAIMAVFVPSVSLAAYAWGQLPTLVALTIGLALVATAIDYVEHGGGLRLGLVAGLTGVAVAAHHATALLFLPFALAAALFTVLLGVDRAQLVIRIRRTSVMLATSVVVGAVAIAPFWLWAIGGIHQAFIPHPSRANFIADAWAQSLFLWAEYGIVPALALAGLWLRRDRRTPALATLAVLMAILGLGGTTALPSLLLGSQWQWLTYDRFAVWGSVAMLPLAGIAIDYLLSMRLLPGRILAVASLTVLFAYAGDNAGRSVGAPTASRQVAAIAAFMNDGRTQWRYQTFGMGNDAARLGYLTRAGTIDGSYYSARRLPELTSSGIGNVDDALGWDPSGAVLSRLLARADAYSIRWTFNAQPRYDPYLVAAGFVPRGSLAGGITIWEKPSAPALPAAATAFGAVSPAGILWGTLPLFFVVLAAGFAVAQRRTSVEWETRNERTTRVVGRRLVSLVGD